MNDISHIRITPVTMDDILGFRTMQAGGWREVYPNEEEGVLAEWVHEYTDSWLTPEGLEHSQSYLQPILDNPEHEFMFVAKDGDKTIGMTHASNADGKQRLHALYVDSEYYGKGVGQALLNRALEYLDKTQPITLSVVRYNQRAIRFYEKNGFEKILASESLHETRHPKLKLPAVEMIRKGEK